MSAARSRLPHRQANGSTHRPGGHSAKNARRAGAPTTHQSSQETPIMATRRRCSRSGWPADNFQPRKPFRVEGVHFL
jgi:hypothetical protein